MLRGRSGENVSFPEQEVLPESKKCAELRAQWEQRPIHHEAALNRLKKEAFDGD